MGTQLTRDEQAEAEPVPMLFYSLHAINLSVH